MTYFFFGRQAINTSGHHVLGTTSAPRNVSTCTPLIGGKTATVCSEVYFNTIIEGKAQILALR